MSRHRAPKLRPIRTVPKDGTPVLLFECTRMIEGQPDFCTIDVGAWEWIADGDVDGGGYFGWASNYGNIEDPIYWLPVPTLAPKKRRRS